MKELRAQDTIAGKEGRAYAKINSNNEEMFYAKKIEAKVEKNKSEIKSIGKRLTGHKTTGGNGTGSMTLYRLSPLFRKIVSDWVKTGKDTYFDMVVENDDKGSAAGKQTTLLRGVNLDSDIVALLDGDSDDALEEEVEFTFESYEILTPFKKF